MSNIAITVVIPMYNVDAFIKETLDCLINQTLNDIEIILVDDESTDDTLKIVEEYLKYGNVHLLTQKNSGPGAARNKGKSLAKGQYIKFLDSDDILPLDGLEKEYNLCVENEVDLLIVSRQNFNKSGMLATHENLKLRHGELNVINDNLFYNLGSCVKLFRKDLLEDVSFPESIKIAEDHPFNIELYLKAKKIYNTDEKLYYYRIREADQNVSLSKEKNHRFIYVLENCVIAYNLSKEIFDKYLENPHSRRHIELRYLNRFIRLEIWPPILNTFKAFDSNLQLEALTILRDYLKTLDSTLVEKSDMLTLLMFENIFVRVPIMNKQVKDMYFDCLKVYFSKISQIKIFELKEMNNQKVNYIIKAIEKDKIKYLKLYFSHKNRKKVYDGIKKSILKTEVSFAQKVVFKLAKNQKKDDKLIIFASVKEITNKSNLGMVIKDIENKNINLNIRILSKRPNTFKELIKFYYLLGKSKCIILDDYYNPIYGLEFGNENNIIQIWHACGSFKKFGFSSIGQIESNTEYFEINAHKSYTKVVVNANADIKNYAQAFNIEENKVLSLGVPRTDLLFDSQYLDYFKNKFKRLYPDLEIKNIITYAPTFRGNVSKRASFKLELDIQALYENFKDDYVLILKMHPAVRNSLQIDDKYKGFVYDFSEGHDINDLLSVTDILITDYSSLIYEFSIFEKPMIFFTYDYNQYIKDRGFYNNFKLFVPGNICETNEEIINVIKYKLFDLDKVKKFKHENFDTFDGKSSSRISELILETIFKK